MFRRWLVDSPEELPQKYKKEDPFSKYRTGVQQHRDLRLLLSRLQQNYLFS